MTAAVALALALPASGYAAQGVHFDPDGTGGAGTEVVNTFDWGPAQVLYSNCFGAVGAVTGTTCVISAQGSISNLIAPGGALLGVPSGVAYTFAMTTKSTSLANASYDGNKAVVGDNVTFKNIAGGDATSLFTIYVDSTPGAGDPNPLAGTGYTDGTAILTGRVTIVDYAVVNVATGFQNLDQNGTNDYVGLNTLATSGSPTFTIDVLTLNSDYFKDPIASFSLSLQDANQADNSVTPFKQADPAIKVDATAFSAADVGKDDSSDIYCGKGTAGDTCSGQFQGDASTTFLIEVLPEPGMLALLGIGLAGLGAFTRRRGRQDVTAA
jgi:hypothetical protein